MFNLLFICYNRGWRKACCNKELCNTLPRRKYHKKHIQIVHLLTKYLSKIERRVIKILGVVIKALFSLLEVNILHPNAYLAS